MKNDSRAVGNDTGRGLALAVVDGGGVDVLTMGCGGCCGSDGSEDDDDFAVGRPAKSVQPSRRKTVWTRMQAAKSWMQCGPGALHVQERIQLPLTSVHVLILLPIRARITVSVHWSDTSDSPRLLKMRLARLRSVGEKMAGSCERFGQTAIHAGGSLGWAISLSIFKILGF